MNVNDPEDVNSNKNVLCKEQNTFTDGKKSNLTKCLLALVVIFAITTAVFVGFFTYYYGRSEGSTLTIVDQTKSQDTVHHVVNCSKPTTGEPALTTTRKATTTPATTTTATTTTTTSTTTTTTTTEVISTEPKTCQTAECVEAAAAMIRMMKREADPCQDFYEFACGRFLDETTIPDSEGYIDSFSHAMRTNLKILRTIAEGNIETSDPHYLINIKKFYKSCMDEDQIESLGVTPYLNETDYVNDWPTLNSAWHDLSLFPKDAMVKYTKLNLYLPFYDFDIRQDPKDTNKKVIYLTDGALGLSREYLMRSRNDSVVHAYENYLAKVAKFLGADSDVAERDADQLVDLERALAEVMIPREEQRDDNKMYNPTTLAQLDVDYPELGIAATLRSAFATANMTLEDNEVVINEFPTYIGNITGVISRFDNRTLQNMFGFKFALSRVGGLTKKLREIHNDFEKVLFGTTAEPRRWKYCVSRTSGVFSLGMAKEFVKNHFSEEAKEYMYDMITKIKMAFKSMLDENTWMGQTTKTEAYEKLAAMTNKVGYPDTKFSVEEINQSYENYLMSADHYYQNLVQIDTLSYIRDITSLRKPVDKTEWDMSAFDVNAYYSPSDNQIVFPAGILQPPFFSPNFRDAANYGAIGWAIGHEITHGFDDRGSQYDKDGNLRNWWGETDRENFLQRTQCLVDQYGRFEVSEINMTVNGILTLGENIADNGGLKESFRAYKDKVATQGEEDLLPGLGLTNDQIFFLAFGQINCGKRTKASMISGVLSDPHSPGKFRVIGTLQNSPDFSRAYNCQAGTYMNPPNKCEVW